MLAKKLYWAGENVGPIKVDDWPQPPRSYLTISWNTQDFAGTITLMASIKLNPDEDDWFEIHSQSYERVTFRENKSRNGVLNIPSGYISLKAIVDHSYGRVDRIVAI